MRCFVSAVLAVQSSFRKIGPSNGDASDCINRCLGLMYEGLKENATFQTSFASPEAFSTIFQTWNEKCENLLAKRRASYDGGANQCINNLVTLCKQVPEMNPNDTQPFIQAVKDIDKKLLEQCDIAGDILSAVEKDVHAFGCTSTTLLSSAVVPWHYDICFGAADIHISYYTICFLSNIFMVHYSN